MDPLTEDRSPPSHQRARDRFLPAESPLLMSTQQLRVFQRGDTGRKTPAYIRLRRACIFISTAALTVAGCYEMYEVLQVGGVTILEWMVLVLFVMLFAWIAFSFMSALAGFAVLLFSSRTRLASIRTRRFRPSAAEMRCCCRPTMKIPIGSWLAFGQCTSRSINPDMVQASTGLCSATRPTRRYGSRKRNAFCNSAADLGAANIYYRHRRENTARKSGNIEDWIKRFGAAYDHMIILDADSLMTGDTIVRLASAMEAHPAVALIQTLPIVVNAKTLFARLQQFSGRLIRPADRRGHRMVARLRRQLLGA